MKRVNAIWVVVLIVSLVGVEVRCAQLAWHTIGEVESFFLLLATGLNFWPVAFLIGRFRKPAVVSALLVFMLLVPYQLLLGVQWWFLQQEAEHIITYAYQVKKGKGHFPHSIATYAFRFPLWKSHFTYTDMKEYGATERFGVCYHIGSTCTAHCFDSKDGWGYYPD